MFSISIILISLAAVLVLVLLSLLLIPFHLLIDIHKDGPLVSGRYELVWFCLPLLKRGISGSVYDILRMQGHREKAVAEEPEAEQEEFTPRSDLQAILEALPALARAFRELLGSIHMEKLFCHLRFGSGDPADTAFYSGCLWPFIVGLSSWGAHLFLQPCFEEEVLEGSLIAELKASLIWFIVPLLKVLREERARRLLVQMARGYRG
jgi:hypothetical protein